MNKKFSTAWKGSKQPRKQRKYRANAPAHVRQKFMGVHLGKKLRDEHKTRSVEARIGDKVKVLRGQFKGKSGEVTRLDRKRGVLYIDGVEQPKKDGSKAQYPINPSNCQMETLVSTDKRRFKDRTAKPAAKAPAKAAPAKKAETKKEEKPKATKAAAKSA